MLPFPIASFFTPRVIIALLSVVVLTALLWKAYNSGYQNGSFAIQVKFDQYILVQQEAALQARVEAESRERDLAAQMTRLEQVAKNERAGIVERYESVIAGLRDRPVRPASNPDNRVSETSSATTNCTGAELARGDATFLAGYAADAARLGTALEQCITAYQSVQNLVESQ